MRLKRLEVRGFKSFADRTEFDFKSDLTGIVGPNGCGKSNVVDALKWVLGDQRAKSLRGAEMTDVIFKGAEGRDAMPVAEVTVHLEDDNGLLGERSEVRIGRRLTRDKESDYLIDGAPVRLKDVRDLLLDTGLGVGAYSVMEQGRIDAVLSANPESRRAIFEEAAGISKFKLQKRESLRKLDRTEQNLARVQDLLEERARRIRSLRIQAGRARRYRELRGALRDIKAALAVIDGRGHRDGAHALRGQIEELEQRLIEAERVYDESAEQIEAQEHLIAQAETLAEAAQERLREAKSKREQLQSRRESAERRAEELQIDADGCAERVAELEEQRNERRDELGRARAELVELEQGVIDVHKECEQRHEETRDANARVGELQQSRERAREGLLEWLHARTRNRNATHDQEVQKRNASSAASRLDERLADLDLDRVTQRAEIDDKRGEVARLEGEIAAVQEREQAGLVELEGADREVAEFARRESATREDHVSVRSRIDVLEGMEQHFEGLDQGPRFLLEQQPEGLRGRLLDLLEVALEDSKALEAALGSYVQALVVDTRAHADAMLETLANEQKGRAMLLVEEEFHDDLGLVGSALAAPNDSTPLVDLVTCADSARSLTRWLLRGVYVVETLAEARADRADLCYVTRDGGLLCGPRIEGGGGEGQGGLVVRRAEIQTLHEKLDLIDRDLSALRAELELGTERASALRDRVRELGTERAGLREREQHLRSEIGHLEGRVADLDRQHQTFSLEHAEAVRSHLEALTNLSDLILGGMMIERAERAAERAEAEVGSELEAAQSKATELGAAEQELRVKHAAMRSERDSLAHRLGTLEQALRDLDRAAVDLDERRARAVEGVEDARTKIDDVDREISSAGEEIVVLETASEDARGGLDDARQQKADLQDRHRATERSRDDARTSIGERRLALADVEHKFARLEERLREDTGVELDRCLGLVDGRGLEVRDIFGPPAPDYVEVLIGPPLPPNLTEPERELSRLWLDEEFDVGESRKQEKVLQSQMDRLGAVNLDAVEELEQEEGNYEQLEQDVQDLNESRKSLIEALRQMEAESRTLFERTFHEARENFRTIFRKLFQGGRADMYLAEGEDSLDSGIEIVAKPPGKELQSIALLSGGERSLTALAILFAVFKVKPSPFCILDEVDAALDDTNVERFIRVLDDFVGDSQFCIVTHHKRTMAACEMLYGITMQKRGVSTRMAVALEEVDGFADGADSPDAPAPVDPARKQRIAGEEQVGF